MADPSDSSTSQPSRTNWSDVGAVCLLAAVPRLIWGLFVPMTPTSDCAIYDMFAMRIADGHGYSWPGGQVTAFWPVGTSMLYSLFYRAFGHSFGPVVAFNLFLGVAVVALTMVLVNRWFGRGVARTSGLLMACWPLLIEYTTIIASELPFLAAMLVAWVAWTDRRIGLAGRSLVAGLALAAASYIRPTALLLPAILAMPEVVLRRQFRGQIVQLALVGLVMAACFAPWVARNRRVFGEFVLISTNGGTNTWMGNSPGSTGLFRADIPYVEGMNEAQSDRYRGRLASAFIREHPAQFVQRSLTKLVRVHERESIGITWNQGLVERKLAPKLILGLKLATNLYWWTILGLGLVGLIVLWRSNGFWPTLLHPSVLIWGYFAGVHAVTVVQDRYHMPCMTSIAALAALALSKVVSLWRPSLAPEK